MMNMMVLADHAAFANRRVLNIKDFAFTMYRGVRNELNEDNCSTVSNYVCAEYFF